MIVPFKAGTQLKSISDVHDKAIVPIRSDWKGLIYGYTGKMLRSLNDSSTLDYAVVARDENIFDTTKISSIKFDSIRACENLVVRNFIPGSNWLSYLKSTPNIFCKTESPPACEKPENVFNCWWANSKTPQGLFDEVNDAGKEMTNATFGEVVFSQYGMFIMQGDFLSKVETVKRCKGLKGDRLSECAENLFEPFFKAKAKNPLPPTKEKFEDILEFAIKLGFVDGPGPKNELELFEAATKKYCAGGYAPCAKDNLLAWFAFQIDKGKKIYATFNPEAIIRNQKAVIRELFPQSMAQWKVKN